MEIQRRAGDAEETREWMVDMSTSISFMDVSSYLVDVSSPPTNRECGSGDCSGWNPKIDDDQAT